MGLFILVKQDVGLAKVMREDWIVVEKIKV